MKKEDIKFKRIKQPICKYCESGQLRFNKDKIICRRCGNEEKRKEDRKPRQHYFVSEEERK